METAGLVMGAGREAETGVSGGWVTGAVFSGRSFHKGPELRWLLNAGLQDPGPEAATPGRLHPWCLPGRWLGLYSITTLGLGMLVEERGSRVTSKQVVGAEVLDQGEDTAHF